MSGGRRHRTHQRLARELGAHEGISYSEALERVRAEAEPPAPEPQPTAFAVDGECAERLVTRALQELPHVPVPSRSKHRYHVAVDAEAVYERLSDHFSNPEIAMRIVTEVVERLGGAREVGRRPAPEHAQMRSKVNDEPWRQSYWVYVVPAEIMVTDELIAHRLAHVCNTSPVETIDAVVTFVPAVADVVRRVGWVEPAKGEELVDAWMARHGARRGQRRPAVQGLVRAPADARVDVYEVPATAMERFGHVPLRNAVSWA